MEIIENNRHYLKDFISLNEEWISSYFMLEAVDHSLAENPGKVIDNGGYIFSLLLDNQVVGVCALFNEGNGIFELARMAVSPAHQGKGYASLLIEACLNKIKMLSCLLSSSSYYFIKNWFKY